VQFLQRLPGRKVVSAYQCRSA